MLPSILVCFYVYLEVVVLQYLDERVPESRDLESLPDLLDQDDGVHVRADVVQQTRDEGCKQPANISHSRNKGDVPASRRRGHPRLSRVDQFLCVKNEAMSTL